MSLGQRLRLARENKGWTQVYVAKLLGITSQALSNYERGERDPDTPLLNRLAELYGVSVDYLLGRTDDPTPYTLPPHTDPAGDADKEALLLFGRISRLSKAGKEQILKALEWVEAIEEQERKAQKKKTHEE
jgi:transcriptional regulator with XRE-family HTH domain